ncbi:hypothetical protein ACJRO7_036034, partial [Eucalyptus globulus]
IKRHGFPLNVFQTKYTPRINKTKTMPSSYSHRWTLDIFVSYEDNDSKVNRFTSILFAKLKQARIGSRDSHERSNNLFKAIRQARFALVVFSANYADSSQCLDDP